MSLRSQDFSFVLKLINDHVLRSTAEPAKAQSKSDKKRSHDSSSSLSFPTFTLIFVFDEIFHFVIEDSQPSKRSHSSSRSSVPPPGALGTPIFIVPDALTSVFSGYNAAQFLQDGIFVSSGKKSTNFLDCLDMFQMLCTIVDECRQRGLKRNPDGHRFSHTCKNGKIFACQLTHFILFSALHTCKYIFHFLFLVILIGKVIDFKVIDTAKKLSAEEWNRVVVVFVQGQTWQFKGWQ